MVLQTIFMMFEDLKLVARQQHRIGMASTRHQSEILHSLLLLFLYFGEGNVTFCFLLLQKSTVMETKAIEASNTTFLFGAKFSADASYVIAGDGR